MTNRTDRADRTDRTGRRDRQNIIDINLTCQDTCVGQLSQLGLTIMPSKEREYPWQTLPLSCRLSSPLLAFLLLLFHIRPEWDYADCADCGDCWDEIVQIVEMRLCRLRSTDCWDEIVQALLVLTLSPWMCFAFLDFGPAEKTFPSKQSQWWWSPKKLQLKRDFNVIAKCFR